MKRSRGQSIDPSFCKIYTPPLSCLFCRGPACDSTCKISDSPLDRTRGLCAPLLCAIPCTAGFPRSSADALLLHWGGIHGEGIGGMVLCEEGGGSTWCLLRGISWTSLALYTIMGRRQYAALLIFQGSRQSKCQCRDRDSRSMLGCF